jgi:hypothetical protein
MLAMRTVVAVVILALAIGLLGPATGALAHGEEKGVPAVTLVQEAIAILAEHPGEFPPAEIVAHARDKVADALESTDTRGVRLDLVKQAGVALDAGRSDQALVLLEQSIGACPGAPVIEPETAPRIPPTLTSPCPPVPHLRALRRTPVGGVEEPVLIAVGAVLIVAGLGLARRVR